MFNRACAAMGGFDINLRKSEITPDHFHCAMPQDVLQCVRVAAVANAAREIFNVVSTEIGGFVYIDGNGALCHQAPTQILTSLATITDADIEDGSLELSSPWESQRNSATIVVTPRARSAESTIWTLGEPRLVKGNSSSRFTVSFEYNNQSAPAYSIITPVPSTDFQANTVDDGSGTNVTANFVFVIKPAGNNAEVTIYNNGGADAYVLNGAKIRGVAVYSMPETSVNYSNVAQNEDKVEFILDNPYYQSAEYAQTDATFLIGNLARNRAFVGFTLKPNPDLQFKIDLGSLLTLNFTKTGTINRRVAYIKHEFDQKLNRTLTTIYCEPVLVPAFVIE